MSDPILALPRFSVVGEQPFQDDLLNRKQLAIHLTSYLNRLQAGAVVAIDASWGEGKTWFGRNWAAHLKNESHKVIYIDAFEQDYIEDPFMLLSAEILEVMGENDLAPKLTETATNIAKALIPMGMKMIVNTIGQWALGTSNLSEKAKEFLEGAVDDSAEASGGWIKDRLMKHAGDKVMMQQFKEQLTQFANSDPERPIVIFIDELDRCKPTFAVELIERIKHFFDVPNIVFVLLLNRDQLEKAVKGVYGAETDGAAYLEKFINFFLSLPKPKATDYDAEKNLKKLVSNTFNKYKFPNQEKQEELINFVAYIAIKLNISLRKIERAIAMYAFAYPVSRGEFGLIYAALLKQYDYALFDKLVDGDIEAHETMLEKIHKCLISDQERGQKPFSYALDLLIQWHQAYINNFREVGEKLTGLRNTLEDIEYGITEKQILPYFAKKLDLVLEI